MPQGGQSQGIFLSFQRWQCFSFVVFSFPKGMLWNVNSDDLGTSPCYYCAIAIAECKNKGQDAMQLIIILDRVKGQGGRCNWHQLMEREMAFVELGKKKTRQFGFTF